MKKFCSRCYKEQDEKEFADSRRTYKTCFTCRSRKNSGNRVRLPDIPLEIDGKKICSGCNRSFPLSEYAYKDRDAREYSTCTACRARKSSARTRRKGQKQYYAPTDELMGNDIRYIKMLRVPLNQITEVT